MPPESCTAPFMTMFTGSLELAPPRVMGAEILVDPFPIPGHISEPFIEDHLRQAHEGGRKIWPFA